MAKWDKNYYQKKWLPKVTKYSNEEFEYVLLDDIPEVLQIGLPQFVGHDNIIEIDEKIGFKYHIWEAWLKYMESTKDIKWLVKGRGKNSDVPLTENELKIIRQGQ